MHEVGIVEAERGIKACIDQVITEVMAVIQRAAELNVTWMPFLTSGVFIIRMMWCHRLKHNRFLGASMLMHESLCIVPQRVVPIAARSG